jgi:hypothetical protein
MECIACLTDFEGVKYRQRDGEWLDSPYCEDCINWFITSQWDSYVNTIKTETCKKTVKNLILAGPPLYVREPIGLPCGDQGVYEFKIGDNIISGRLENVYENEEMDTYKRFLSEYLLTILEE